MTTIPEIQDPPLTLPLEPGSDPTPASAKKHRRVGRIARLPKDLRDKLNQLLDDGLPYGDIIQQLDLDAHDINEDILSTWKKGGYQDWLLHQDWIEQIRLNLDSAGDLVRDFDSTQVNHAALQLGSLHFFEALRDLGPGSLDKKLGGDSRAFARLIHALSRSSRETLQLQKYRDACIRARAELQNLKDPKRPLTEDEHRAIVLKVDDILGLRMQEGLPAQYSPELLAKAQELLNKEAAAAAREEGRPKTESPETPPQ